MFQVGDIIYWKNPSISGTWKILSFDGQGKANLIMESAGIHKYQQVGHVLNHWPITHKNLAQVLKKGCGKSHPLTNIFKD